MALSPELRTRAISGAILGAAVLFITWWSAESFALLCVIAAFILLHEWRTLTRHRHPLFLPLGVVYIAAACISLIYLRYEHMAILLSVFVIVWTGDIAAYLFGKRFGKHKIAPRISPGKSWEGLVAAIIASASVAAVLGNVAPISHAVLGAFLAVLGLGGDLFESALKRHAGVKDSGRLIPGHGGLFDRVDALLPCAIFAAVALYIRLNMQ
jgi:phosphatidate cytidylyltransferase